MKRAGYERLIAARAIVTTPSSIGWRSTSSTFLRKSGSSSRNSTPPCARLTSPGRGYDPPPISPASEMVWCGARNGRRATSDSPSARTPATEWILVVSSASSRLILGRTVGSRRASIVFPDPGGPIIRRLCPPAAATSSARFAWAWPFTSAKSTSSRARSANSPARSRGGQVDGDTLQRKRVARVRDRGVHPLPPFLYGALRQPHGREGGEAVRDVGLDLDEIGVDTEHGGGADAGEHARRYDGTTERW